MKSRPKFQGKMDQAVATFHKKSASSSYADQFKDEAAFINLLNVYTDYKTAKLTIKTAEASKELDARFTAKYPELFKFLKPKKDKDAKKIYKSLKKLASKRKSLRRQIKEEQIENSFLGMVGRGFEPLTQWAGFDWKINVAILSSFAARESSVATIGVLYQQGADENKRPGRSHGGGNRRGRLYPASCIGHHGLLCHVSALSGHHHHDQGADRFL